MDAKTLLIDIAIISLILLVGMLVYLALPSRTSAPEDAPAQVVSTTTAPTTELKIEILKEGNGAVAGQGQEVAIDYVGRLADGTEFDASSRRGVPLVFILGTSAVIPGWDLGILGMKVGEKRRLIIPPELAYGENGFPRPFPRPRPFP